MRRSTRPILPLLLALLTPLPCAAGEANGTLTIDGEPVALRHAYAYSAENLFDSELQDTIVLLTDRPLPAGLGPDDDFGLGDAAERGEIVALRLRLTDGSATGAALFHQPLGDILIFPGRGLEYDASRAPAGSVGGSLETARPLAFEEHSWEARVSFQAAIAAPMAEDPGAPAAPAPSPQAESSPVPGGAATDPESARRQGLALMEALMAGKPEVALAFIEAGADVNATDDSDLTPLNWAIMMCQPSVVQALIDAGADIGYERVEGFTMLMEAAACPEAAQVLRRAGAD